MSIIVSCVLVIGLIAYLAVFIIKDTLPLLPNNANTKNLFNEKDSIDISKLRKTANINDNKIFYDSISMSLKEDSINDFITQNQYHSLWKKLNFTYIEQFISLADKYFAQKEWRSNNFVNDRIAEIRGIGFIERNTPMWNRLVGYENSIAWYNNAQNCINQMNSVISQESYFVDNNLSQIAQCKNNLTSQNCRKNKIKLSELNQVYENLKNRSYHYLSSKINQYDKDFESSNKNTYLHDAYQNFDTGRNEVGLWNGIFYNSSDLNNQLQNYKNKIDYYYY